MNTLNKKDKKLKKLIVKQEQKFEDLSTTEIIPDRLVYVPYGIKNIFIQIMLDYLKIEQVILRRIWEKIKIKETSCL